MPSISRAISLDEVQSHKAKDDVWIVVRGNVYNATSFVDEHPGGGELILDVAGEDATEAYLDAEHSEEADEILSDLLLGTLKETSTVVKMLVDEKASAPLGTTALISTGVLKPDEFQEFALEKKTVISHNVAIYRFTLPSPESVFGLPIGQHISISADIVQPDGTTKEVIRSYTPVSGDHHLGYFDLLIKEYDQGNISRHIACLAIGQKIRVRGPKGAFTYVPNMVRRFGMIAGGTGITPMLQIINAIVRGRSNGDRTEVDLIFANVNRDDILLFDDLVHLVDGDKGIRVYYVLNNPPEAWTGDVGFVTAGMVRKYLPPPADDTKILLCGPPPMVSAMKKITESLGFAKARPVSKLQDQVFTF